VALEEGVGRVDEIYAVVPLVQADGSIQLQVAKGGVFAYYEFPWPADDRLTDEKWREMLDAGEAPDRPQWTESFFSAETEEAAVQQAIYQFQRNLGFAYWSLGEYDSLYPATEEVQARFQAVFDELRAEKHFVGRQWINASYRSFDRQAEDTIVVTVRETWQDSLYAFQEAPGDAEPLGEPLAARGPYTLDVTYTLQRGENGWQISNVVYANEPPPWPTQ
jgi:hypothetical protein